MDDSIIRFLKNRKYEDKETQKILSQYKHRISSVDGEPRVVTSDYNPERLNLSLEEGIIIKIDLG